MSEEKNTGTSTLAKQGSITLFGNIIGKVLGFLFVAIATRLVSPDDYGLFVLGSSIVVFTHGIVSLNIYAAVDYFVPQYLRESDFGKAKGILRNVLMVGLLFSFLGSGFIYLSRNMIADLFTEPGLIIVLALFAALIPILTLYNLLVKSFNSIKKMYYRSLMKDFIYPSVKILSVIIFISLGAGVTGLIGGYLLGTAVAVLFGTVFFFREADWLRGTSSKPVSNQKIISYAFPLAMAGVIYSLIGQVDTFIIGFFLTSSEVGHYQVAYLLATNLLIFLKAITPIFKPIVAEAKSNTQVIESRYQLTTRWVTMLTLPPAITLVLAPEIYLSVLFTEEYIVASVTTAVLVLGYLLNAASGPEGMVLEGLGYTKLTFFNSIVLMFINTFLGLLLVPELGILGAGIATSAALGLTGLLGVAEIYYFLGFHPYTKDLFYVYLAAILPIGGGILVISLITSSILIAILLPPFMILSYILGLRITNAFTEQDIEVGKQFDEKIGYSIASRLIT